MSDSAGPPDSPAFLLTQLGTQAATRFAERVAEIDLTPPECGVLGVLSRRPGMSQQELSEVLGMIPSRVVPLVDGLEESGLVQRVRHETDRRRNSLQLTRRGKQALASVGRIAQTHDREFLSALSTAEQKQLRGLLTRLADSHHLTPGVHPGYRTLDTRRD